MNCSVSVSIIFFIALHAVCIRAAFDTRNGVSSLFSCPHDALPYQFVATGWTAQTTPSHFIDGLDIVDVVILASVDGKLHALNRTTGVPLWSVADHQNSPQSPFFNFDFHVRTQRENSDQDLFIIEPGSGDIYVLPPMASSSDPLQRLPFSMSQLVEMSPFSFPGDDHRVFVGSKEMRTIVVELDTGRVKGKITTDKECFWNGGEDDLDSDELDGTRPLRYKLQSREVHIGRTDYHVHVHVRNKGMTQNLDFSSYSAQDIDREKQSQWTRTPDDLYIQPLSNGHVLAFKTHGAEEDQQIGNDGMPIWSQSFTEPIVAIFDVLMTPARPNPLVLLQPLPRIEQLFPRRTAGTSKSRHARAV